MLLDGIRSSATQATLRVEAALVDQRDEKGLSVSDDKIDWFTIEKYIFLPFQVNSIFMFRNVFYAIRNTPAEKKSFILHFQWYNLISYEYNKQKSQNYNLLHLRTR